MWPSLVRRKLLETDLDMVARRPVLSQHALLQAPTPFPALLRCFVERSETGQGVCFLLHQGERSDRDASKFLMAAELSRWVALSLLGNSLITTAPVHTCLVKKLYATAVGVRGRVGLRRQSLAPHCSNLMTPRAM